jgi:dTDP-4-amino-4,6-dideoxygalactose transaminase
MCQRRRRNAEILRNGLKETPGLRFQRVMPQAQHAFHHFCVAVDSGEFGMDRDGLAAALNERGIATAVYYRIPPHRQPLFADCVDVAPRTDDLSACSLALPVHHDLTDADLGCIVTAVRHAQRCA